jgi:TolA-binding protein
MKPKLILCSYVLFTFLGSTTGFAQTAAALADHGTPQSSGQETVASAGSPQGAPVSYASVTQVNGLLAQLESASKATQVDLAKLRIERWKTDGSSKKQALGNVDSIQRNLQNALPEIIGQLRNSPEDMPATFKLYRNLDALYDVLGSVVEAAGAFGSKDDFQVLSNDLNSFESTRKQIGERLENLAASKEQEIVRLRTDLKTAQAAIPLVPPKKIVVDDTEPPKKPAVKKKPVVKKPATTPPGTTPATTPPAQNPPPAQAKPQ